MSLTDHFTEQDRLHPVHGQTNLPQHAEQGPSAMITDGAETLGIWAGEFDCHPAQAAELEQFFGDGIYRDAQLAPNLYPQETTT